MIVLGVVITSADLRKKTLMACAAGMANVMIFKRTQKHGEIDAVRASKASVLMSSKFTNAPTYPKNAV